MIDGATLESWAVIFVVMAIGACVWRLEARRRAKLRQIERDREDEQFFELS